MFQDTTFHEMFAPASRPTDRAPSDLGPRVEIPTLERSPSSGCVATSERGATDGGVLVRRWRVAVGFAAAPRRWRVVAAFRPATLRLRVTAAFFAADTAMASERVVTLRGVQTEMTSARRTQRSACLLELCQVTSGTQVIIARRRHHTGSR